MRELLALAIAAGVTLCICTEHASAQAGTHKVHIPKVAQVSASIDWSSTASSFTACPSSLSPGNSSVNIKVTNLNTILYQYDLNVSNTIQPIDDDAFANIAGLLPKPP